MNATGLNEADVEWLLAQYGLTCPHRLSGEQYDTICAFAIDGGWKYGGKTLREAWEEFPNREETERKT